MAELEGDCDELLARCKNVHKLDTAAWDEFSRCVLIAARRIARIQAKSLGLAYDVHGEDIVMETWIAFQANAHGINHVRAWLRTAIRNRMISLKRSPRMRLEDLVSDMPVEGTVAPATTYNPALYAAIRALPPDIRQCMFEFYWLDLAIEVIAARNEVPVGTVKSRLHRGRAHIAEALEH